MWTRLLIDVNVLTQISPTAGGLLTDRVASDPVNNQPTRAQGRGAQRHNDRYVKPEIVAGLKTLYDKCQTAGSTVQGAALRWLVYHSALGEEDGVILGASKIEQIDDSAAEIAKGPLKGLEKAFEELWENVKDVAPVGY
jgi:aflatoxin B1 aldehyde reductase